MTVGEKIQFYRKKTGLSQEELGQKMSVSRQTVSLWEMNKTLPTVDNLIRLKEIFSVSIDEILNNSQISENIVINPKEYYIFKFSESDLGEVFKKAQFPIIKNTVIFTITFIVFFVLFVELNAPDIIMGLIWGYFLIGVIQRIKGYFLCRKTWKSNKKRILESTYSYEIYDKYFVLNISRNEEVKKTLKIYPDDIDKNQFFGNYIMLQISGQNYIIKKEVLNSDSVFFNLKNQMPEKIEKSKQRDFFETISIILFVLSIASVFGAMITVATLSAINQMFTENMWLFFLFLPIPIASVVFGFFIKKKGYKYKKNILAGLIMSVLLCTYGSFSFIFADVYSHSDEPILMAEETLSIDIPTPLRINTQDWTKGTQSIPRGYIYSTSDVYFDQSAVEDFESNLSGDSKWITDIPNEIIGITSYFCDIQKSDYYIIYNKDTKEYNKLPEESGTYVFINVLYNVENNTMKLVEYQIEYTK